MTQRAIVLAVLLLAVAVGVAAAADNGGRLITRQGNGNGAPPCASCHGPSGMGNAAAGYPRLAGLNAAYLVRQLNDYDNGTRNHPVKSAIASRLSPAEREALARYYAGLPVLRQAPAETAGTDPAVLLRGQRIVEGGAWSKGVPACLRCHGPNGEGVPPHFPPLVDQPGTYIVAQLVAWQNGTRSNDPIGLMRSVASKLDSEEIAAAAAWLASRAPSPSQQRPAKPR